MHETRTSRRRHSRRGSEATETAWRRRVAFFSEKRRHMRSVTAKRNQSPPCEYVMRSFRDVLGKRKERVGYNRMTHTLLFWLQCLMRRVVRVDLLRTPLSQRQGESEEAGPHVQHNLKVTTFPIPVTAQVVACMRVCRQCLWVDTWVVRTENQEQSG
jgi:hypothetical protein